MTQIYDYAIIGGGLSGLALATALTQKSQNVLILESNDALGGANRFFADHRTTLGIRTVPNTPEARAALHFLGDLLGVEVAEIASGTRPSQVQTFSSGEFKHFLGFGEQAPAFYDELKYYLADEEIILKRTPSEWTRMLIEKFTSQGGQFQCRSIVNRIHQEGKFASSITINGHRSLHAEKYIYCGNLKELPQLLPTGILGTRQRSKMNQSLFWNALCLDLLHSKPITDQSGLFLLDSATPDDLGPCVGRFHPQADDNTQLSQWVSFVDGEHQEDDESTVLALKKMKKQIKRAFPEAFDHLNSEKIFLAPQMGGHGNFKLEEDFSVPGLKNFWVGNGIVSGHANLVGSLLQAQCLSTGFGVALQAPPVVSPSPA